MKTVGGKGLICPSRVGCNVDKVDLVFAGDVAGNSIEFIDLPGDDAPVTVCCKGGDAPVGNGKDEDVVRTTSCNADGLLQQREELGLIFFG